MKLKLLFCYTNCLLCCNICAFKAISLLSDHYQPIYCSVLMSGYFQWCRELLSCHKASFKVLRRVRKNIHLTQGLWGHLLKKTASKEDHAFHRIMRRKSFLSASKITVELIRRTGCPVFVCTAQGSSVADVCCSRHPDWHLIIATVAACWQTSTKTGTLNLGLMRYLMMSPGLASTIMGDLFAGCNSPIAFQQHDEKLQHAHYGCKCWLCTHQQIAHENGAMVPVPVPVCLCDTPVILDISPLESPRPQNRTIFSTITDRILLSGLPCWFEIMIIKIIIIQRRVTAECYQRKCATLPLWEISEISNPEKEG